MVCVFGLVLLFGIFMVFFLVVSRSREGVYGSRISTVVMWLVLEILVFRY